MAKLCLCMSLALAMTNGIQGEECIKVSSVASGCNDLINTKSEMILCGQHFVGL